MDKKNFLVKDGVSLVLSVLKLELIFINVKKQDYHLTTRSVQNV